MHNLNEILSTAAPWQWEDKSRYLMVATFSIEDVNYRMIFVRDDDYEWSLFLKNTSVDDNRTFSVTGSGNAAKVFSTALEITREFASIRNPLILKVSAEEPNRKSLYLRIIQKLFPTYKVDIGDKMIVVHRPYELKENEITGSEVKSLLKAATDYRNAQKSSSNPLKRLSGLRKDKVEFNDLFSEWVNAGRPDDTRDIGNLLVQEFGYSEKDVDRIYKMVFGEDPGAAPAGKQVESLAAYILKAGLADEVINFIETEYKDELFTSGRLFKKERAVYEDIRQIFELIVKEDRHSRHTLLKSKETGSLGRSRK